MIKKVTYITGNQKKFANAQAFLGEVGIEAIQKTVKIEEIQSNSAIDIAIRKAEDAFKVVGEPLFVNDASWIIPSLGGFPGPYMRYIVEWLSLDDILVLMKNKANRQIILRDTIVYVDKNGQKVFSHDSVGEILEEPQGEPRGPFITQIISLRGDGTSIAEDDYVGFSSEEAKLWREFSDWLKSS